MISSSPQYFLLACDAALPVMEQANPSLHHRCTMPEFLESSGLDLKVSYCFLFFMAGREKSPLICHASFRKTQGANAAREYPCSGSIFSDCIPLMNRPLRLARTSWLPLNGRAPGSLYSQETFCSWAPSGESWHDSQERLFPSLWDILSIWIQSRALLFSGRPPNSPT